MKNLFKVSLATTVAAISIIVVLILLTRVLNYANSFLYDKYYEEIKKENDGILELEIIEKNRNKGVEIFKFGEDTKCYVTKDDYRIYAVGDKVKCYVRKSEQGNILEAVVVREDNK